MKRSSRHSKERKLIPWFLSLLFCMLNGSSLFFCGMCFTVVIIFLTTNRDVSSFVVLVFISLLSNLIISFYILIRELLYKLIHCLGYRAQPDLKVLHMRRGFDIHFPVFEKYGQDYKLLYKKRSKKLQIEYLLICLGYFNGLSLIMITFTALLRGIFELLELESRMASSYDEIYKIMSEKATDQSDTYRTKATERLKARENVTVLAVEHGYPIFATKEEA